VKFNLVDDPYSSNCFGVQFVNLKITGRTSALSHLTIASDLADILQKLNLHYVICKHRLQDVSLIHALEEVGFRLMGIGCRLAFLKTTPPMALKSNNAIRVEQYKQRHQEPLTSLFKNKQRFFSGTHYYNSPYLDSKLVDRFYTNWIVTDFQGRCDNNFVALQKNRIVGFVTCIEGREEAKLDLIWVDESIRRQGIGKMLISTLMNNIKARKLICDTYVTEKKAFGFYLATGFAIQDIYAIYHKYAMPATGDNS
jgi:ribosomal protein S18 acetylase RimI-like enzyme